MKTTLRIILLIAVIVFSVTALMAQAKDVIYLKTGSIIKGTILEMVPDKTIKIQTADGNIFVYNMFEVERISKESAVPSNESRPVVERSYESQRSYESPRGEGSATIFSIYGALALPVGDLGKKDGENAGLAKTGWAAGAQLVTGGSIGLIIDGSYALNKIDLPSDYISSFGYGKSSYSGWSSIIGLIGLKIGSDNATGSNFFIAPLGGVLFMRSPEVTFTPTGSTTSITKLPSGSGTGFAYGGAVEAIFGGRVTLGAKYIASKLKFKFSENGQDYEGDPINRALLLVSLGIAF